MQFKLLSTYFQKLERTSSRNEMTVILSELLSEASLDEIDRICYLLLGKLAPMYKSVEFNMGEKMMLRVLGVAHKVDVSDVKKLMGELGDLGKVCWKLGKKSKDQKLLSVIEVYELLLAIAKDEGQGSQERKVSNYAKLLSTLDPLSAKYVACLPVSTLRLGFSVQTLLDALSWMQAGNKSLKKQVERAFNAAPDVGLIAKTFKKDGLAGLERIQIKVGRPIMPQKCQRVKTAEEMMERMGGAAAVEPKFDGTRTQIHLGVLPEDTQSQVDVQEALGFDVGEAVPPVRIYSRNLEDMTAMFPDLALAVSKSIKAKTAILDGEALGYDSSTGKFIPFQETIKRKRKHGVKEKIGEVPLKLFIFDVLFVDGKSLLSTPFNKRREILEKLVVGDYEEGITEVVVQEAPQIVVKSAKELQREFKKEIADGLEGVVVKSLDSLYEAGARGYSWIKFKGELDSVDCVVLGYYYGRGRRSGFGIGAFLVGVYDKNKDQFVTVAKIGTGLSDEQWVKMREDCDKLAIGEKPKNVLVDKALYPDVWAKPEIVVEIRADEITKSPAHTANYALRFPRLVDWRVDKVATDVTTLEEVEGMYGT